MNVLQKTIISVWVCVVVAMALWPPWTIRRTLHYRSGWEYEEFNTSTRFRFLFAEPEWETYTTGMDNPISVKHTAKLRFDLLAVEILAKSAVGFGLWTLARKKRRGFRPGLNGRN